MVFDTLFAILESISLLINFIVGIFSGLMYVVSELVGLIGAILGLGYIITAQLYGVYSVILIDEWTSIIMLGITITISYRIWIHLKGISIFGFKVG